MYLFVLYTWYVLYILIGIGLYWNVHMSITVSACIIHIVCTGLYCMWWSVFICIDVYLYVLYIWYVLYKSICISLHWYVSNVFYVMICIVVLMCLSSYVLYVSVYIKRIDLSRMHIAMFAAVCSYSLEGICICWSALWALTWIAHCVMHWYKCLHWLLSCQRFAQ